MQDRAKKGGSEWDRDGVRETTWETDKERERETGSEKERQRDRVRDIGVRGEEGSIYG